VTFLITAVIIGWNIVVYLNTAIITDGPAEPLLPSSQKPASKKINVNIMVAFVATSFAVTAGGGGAKQWLQRRQQLGNCDKIYFTFGF